MPVPALPPAIATAESRWELPESGSVLCYHRAGVGRPLLLLHSINATPSAFEVSPFFTQMSLGRPLYAPDLPGFGRSVRLDREYLPRFFARAIIEIIEAIGAGAVDIVALSTTCEFAARAANDAPGLVNSLTCISPTGLTRRKSKASDVGPRVHRFLRTPYLGEGLFRLLRCRPSIRYFLNMAFEGAAPSEMVEYAWATAAQPGASYAPFYFLSTQMFAPDALGSLYLPLRQPALVLYDKDPNVSFTFLEELLAARANWRAVRIPDTNGLPHFEQPVQTEAALLEFLATAAA